MEREMAKDLCITTDFADDLLRAGRHFTKGDLDAMMAFCASLGATRHEWIFDTIWTLYDADSPVGYDLLAVACEAAHRHGMRFDVIYKPFEGGLELAHAALPHTMPRPAGVPFLEEQRGILHAVRPFVATHPEMRIARRPEDADPGGRVAAVRLVKNDDAAVSFGPDALTLLTSRRNGGFKHYEGPVSYNEELEWRPRYPYRDHPCRVLTLGGLDLAEADRYFLIRCRKREGPGGFVNAIENLVELVNEDGNVIPSTPSVRPASAEGVYERLSKTVRLELSRYMRHPEVRARLQDKEWFLAQWEGFHRFDAGWEEVCLDDGIEIAVARGKPLHNAGSLHPIYPEARQSWLEDIAFCVDRGVDGVNIRTANHNRPYEPWAYGFNEPVLERMKHRDNLGEARSINGDAYTQFLREAAELLHSKGKELGVHVHGLMLRHDDRAANNHPFPVNFEYQWETWTRELADYVEFRGASFLRPENQREVTDRIGFVAREAGAPFIYQSMRDRFVVHFDGPHEALAWEMERVRRHPDVTAYNLYETANFSRMNPDTGFEGSPDIVELVRNHWR